MLFNEIVIFFSYVAKDMERLTRYEVKKRLKPLLKGKIVICNIGFPT